MQMIETYCYRVGAGSDKNVRVQGTFDQFATDLVKSNNQWDAAKADYDASPVRGKSFCTLPRHEQVAIVSKYVNRER
jgi:hypothetical protein